MSDDDILSPAAKHAVCAEDHARLGYPGSKPSFSRRLSRLHDRKLLKFLGPWRAGKKKRRFFYTNADVKDDNRDHFILISILILLYLTRAKSVCRDAEVDQVTLPDWEMSFDLGGELVHYAGELDRGTMTLGRMRERFGKYRGASHTLLVVTMGKETRLRNLLDESAKAGVTAFMTTFDAVTADPFGKVWWLPGDGPFGLQV